MRPLPPEDRTFFLVILATALPFMAVGLILTLQRVRPTGLPLWLVTLFFVPFINLLFFLVLAVLPPRTSKEASGSEGQSGLLQRIVPKSPRGRALFSIGLSFPIGIAAVLLAVYVFEDEPITAWEEEARIAFDVIEQPHPIDELSPYRNIEPPHLHDYFRSQRGELRLESIGGGKTRLVGTTWYEHDIWPSAYWHLWSDAIIHRIHLRVLNYIKALSETRVP